MSHATHIDRWPVVVHVLETTEQLFLAIINQNRDYTFVHTHTIATVKKAWTYPKIHPYYFWILSDFSGHFLLSFLKRIL